MWETWIWIHSVLRRHKASRRLVFTQRTTLTAWNAYRQPTCHKHMSRNSICYVRSARARWEHVNSHTETDTHYIHTNVAFDFITSISIYGFLQTSLYSFTIQIVMYNIRWAEHWRQYAYTIWHGACERQHFEVPQNFVFDNPILPMSGRRNRTNATHWPCDFRAKIIFNKLKNIFW